MYGVKLSSDSQTFNANSSSVIQDPDNITLTAQRSNLSAAAVFTTSPSVTLTGSGDTRVLSIGNMGSNDSVVITATVTSTTAVRNAGAENTYSETVTLFRVDAGAAGGAGSPGPPGPSGVRDGGVFSYEESAQSGLSAADVLVWVGSLTDVIAQEIAGYVITSADDNYIRPNDRVLVTDNSAQKAGWRIYTGSAASSTGGIDANDWSSLVVEHFDGSVIVDGTLSADKLTANTTMSNNLTVGSAMILGSGGTFYTPNKTAFTDTDMGFFLDTAGNFHLGDSSHYLKFDASNGTVSMAGNLDITGPTGPTGPGGRPGSTGPTAHVKTAETYDGSSWTEVSDTNSNHVNTIGFGTTTAAICVAGNSGTANIAIVESYDGSSWTETTDINTARNATSGSGTTTAAIIAGGETPGARVTNAEQWNGSAWTEVGDLNEARIHLGGTGTSSSSIVFGGEPGPAVSAKTEQWDGSSWTEIADLSTARARGGSGGNALSAFFAAGATPSATAGVNPTEEWSTPTELKTLASTTA